MNAVGYRLNFATPPDYRAALVWYCRAILRGNPRAMNNAALLFYNGHGVFPNRTEARSLWAQSARRGHLNGQSNLGADLTSDTTLPEAKRREGLAMLSEAAMKGSAQAQQILRQWGDKRPFPPPFDASLAMKLEPAAPEPGTSVACQALTS
jgi:TPR repeat protein